MKNRLRVKRRRDREPLHIQMNLYPGPIAPILEIDVKQGGKGCCCSMPYSTNHVLDETEFNEYAIPALKKVLQQLRSAE